MVLNKKNRLKRKLDFDEVFKKGRPVNGTFLFIKVNKNNQGVSRFGFVVSAKVSKKAVIRNRIRRTLSETARLNFTTQSYDILVIANPSIASASTQEIKNDFLNLLKKI